MNRAGKALFGSLAATARDLVVDGPAVLREVATELYCSLDTPISLSCEILLRYNDLPQLVAKAVDVDSYNCPERLFRDRQAVDFLRKTPFEVEGLDPRSTAKAKFAEAEEQCRVTNSRIRSFLLNPSGFSSVVRKAFCLAGVKIREVLGSTVSSSEWISSCRFGPGAFNHPSARGLTSVYDKLQVSPSVTHDFRDLGAILVMSSPSWARSVTDTEMDGFWPFVKPDHLTAVPGNRVTFVPKTATTERAIAIEPLVNIYAQLGLGKMIRRRLKAIADIDLDDQSVNQQLAREGSIRGYLCTIDLSSASDTVAKEVVRNLLPEGWFSRLDSCRSKIGSLDGSSFLYEKFSSMGNGFTFELESLIFWALAYSACVLSDTPTLVSVYGDDIIIPVQAFETLEEILTFFGFTLNKRKSFRNGLFRESCGKDYYDGHDVRPLQNKEVPKEAKDLFILANGLRRLAKRRASDSVSCSAVFYPAWKAASSALPKSLFRHVRVPAHAGDSDGLVCDWDEAQHSQFVVSHRYGFEGSVGLRLQPRPVKVSEVSNFEGAVASLLYRARDGFGCDYTPVPPRQGRNVAFELRHGAFYGPWTNLGPWT